MTSRTRLKRLWVFGVILFICGLLVWAHSMAVMFIPASWMPDEFRYLGKSLLVFPVDDIAIACFALAWIGYLIWAYASKRLV